MKRKQVEKYLGKHVAIIFSERWFNDAVQSWVEEDEPYFGVLTRVPYEKQSKFYMLKGDEPLATDRACWGPTVGSL